MIHLSSSISADYSIVRLAYSIHSHLVIFITLYDDFSEAEFQDTAELLVKIRKIYILRSNFQEKNESFKSS